MNYSNINRPQNTLAADKQEGRGKVVNGRVTVQPKSRGAAIADNFLSGTVNTAVNNTVQNVITPTIKTGIYNAVTSALALLLWGPEGAPRNIQQTGVNYYNGKPSQVNYAGINKQNVGNIPTQTQQPSGRGLTDVNRITFETRADALAVCDGITDILRAYEVLSISGFCELAGVKSQFTDVRYGWYAPIDVRVEEYHTNYGPVYKVAMPRPTLLD